MEQKVRFTGDLFPLEPNLTIQSVRRQFVKIVGLNQNPVAQWDILVLVAIMSVGYVI